MRVTCDAPLGHPLDHEGDLEVDDLAQLLAVEGVEADDVVETVDELGLEVLEQGAAQLGVAEPLAERGCWRS